MRARGCDRHQPKQRDRQDKDGRAHLGGRHLVNPFRSAELRVLLMASQAAYVAIIACHDQTFAALGEVTARGCDR
jgi:hypothetical protein